MREDIKKRIEQIRRGEVPVGYTRTKEGVLPLKWKEKRLGQLAEVIMGQSPSSKHYNTNNEGKPLIQGNNDRTDRESDPKVWTTQITKECKTGDILMSVRAPVGTVFKSRHNACIGRGICAIRSVYSDYLFQFLIFHEDRWRKNAQGSTFESINRNEIESKEIPFCERDYLEIAETLSTCDRVIDLKKKLIEEKKKVKKWLMQTLLTGMIRVKDIENNTPYEELKRRINQIRNGQVPEGYWSTKSGILPLEWKEKKLGKLGEVIMGQSPSSKHYNTNSEGKPLIQGNNDRTDKESDPKVWTTQITKECKTGDILMSVRAPVGKVFRSRHNACIGRGICAIRSVHSDYLFQFLMFHEDKWGKTAQGSTFESINRNEIESKDIPFCESDQGEIAEILSAADKEIDLLNKDLEQWELKKKSLMQLLLTGTVRTTA